MKDKSLEISGKALEAYLGQEFKGVIVSCSGGVDSTALFRLFWQLSKHKKNFELALFHVHYGLRGTESDADFAFVQALAEQAEVPFFSRKITPEERESRHGESLQEWARRIRYEEFAKLAANRWLIALAHHADDVAENAILRMARGASPAHIAGMTPFEPPFWRPLLGVRKAALAKYLEDEKVAHRHDASNDRLDYSRNVIRHKVLPELEALFPGAIGRIASCAREAQEVGAWNREIIEAMMPPDRQGLARWLSELTPGLGRAALAFLLTELTPQKALRELSRRFLDEVLAAAAQRSSTAYVRQIPGGGTLEIKHDELKLLPHHSGVKENRQDQHTRSLFSPKINAILAPGSHAIVSQGQRYFRLSSNDQTAVNSLSPMTIKLYGVGAGESLRFKGFVKDQPPRAWKLKNLFASWLIPPPERVRWAVVQIDEETHALTDGYEFFRPQTDGSKLAVEPFRVRIETSDTPPLPK